MVVVAVVMMEDDGDVSSYNCGSCDYGDSSYSGDINRGDNGGDSYGDAGSNCNDFDSGVNIGTGCSN